jgi:hypothetical protein
MDQSENNLKGTNRIMPLGDLIIIPSSLSMRKGLKGNHADYSKADMEHTYDANIRAAEKARAENPPRTVNIPSDWHYNQMRKMNAAAGISGYFSSQIGFSRYYCICSASDEINQGRDLTWNGAAIYLPFYEADFWVNDESVDVKRYLRVADKAGNIFERFFDSTKGFEGSLRPCKASISEIRRWALDS